MGSESSVPTYQYVCIECATPLEAVQSFSDPALTECPTCGGRLRKVFSAVGVVFKGSGFYRTDSRKDSKPTAATDGKAAAAAKDSKSTADSGSSAGSSTATKDSGSSSAGSPGKNGSAASSSPSSAAPAKKSDKGSSAA